MIVDGEQTQALSDLALGGGRAGIPRLLRSSFLKHGALVFLATNFANALAFAFHFFAARALGVQLYGSLTSLIGIMTIAGLPASIGMMIVVKYAAEVHAGGEPGKVRALIDRVLFLSGWGAVALLALGAALSVPLASYLRLSTPLDVFVVVVLTAIGLVLTAMRAVLLGVQNFAGFAASIFAESIVRLCCGVGLVILGLGVFGAMTGFLLGVGAALASSFVSLRKHMRTAPVDLHFDLRRLLQSSAGMALGLGAFTALTSLDMILARHYLDARSAGYYGAVAQSGRILLFSCTFVPMLVLPKAAARSTAGVSATKILVNGGIASAVLLGTGLAIFALFPRFIVTALGGAAFASAAGHVFPYGLAMCALALLQVVIYYKISIHRFDFILPLVLAVFFEWIGIRLWHGGIDQVIRVLIVVNVLALAGVSYRVNGDQVERSADRTRISA